MPVGELSEYAGVFKLANCYVGLHVKGQRKTFILSIFSSDIRISQIYTQVFALENGIPYRYELLKSDKPVLTVIKFGVIWYPVKLHTEKIVIIKRIWNRVNQNENIECKYCYATHHAQKIAHELNTHFLPFNNFIIS